MNCFIIIRAQNIVLDNICSLTHILNESSGITFIAPNRLYTHNDSGGDDEIYEIDTLGNLIRTININSANNSDWEDITQDDLNNFYIGDFGNNNNDRTNLRIYKIPSPSSFTGNSVTADIIEFNYPDQTMFPPNPTKRNFDVEGFVWYDDSLFLPKIELRLLMGTVRCIKYLPLLVFTRHKFVIAFFYVAIHKPIVG